MDVENKLAFVSRQLRENDYHIIGFLLTKDYILIKAFKSKDYYYLVIPRILGQTSLDSLDKIMRFNTINMNRLPYNFMSM